ncbi:MAG: 50S ribosomal protein L22 [Deltaproteobacteria bacterium]|nr:50S ribosomal protein L22 [Deltaproteobacteria bacterium]
MEARATQKNAKISVRKARIVVDLVRGRNVVEALDLLRFTRKSGAPLVSRLIDSAVASAKEKDANVDLDSLYVKLAYADKAPNRFMRRWRPRAMGRATRIAKGVSHVTVVLGTEE